MTELVTIGRIQVRHATDVLASLVGPHQTRPYEGNKPRLEYLT